MTLPFSHDDFLDVFGRYNALVWPGVAGLWLITAWVILRGLRRSGFEPRAFFALLAVHWAWSGIAYHWLFFRRINPAAALFAGAFVVEAALFAWFAWSGTPLVASRGLRRTLGVGLVVYGLAYPFLGIALGLRYPRLPLFAVPCPTTLITAGFLLMHANIARVLKIVPIGWAFLGSSAAIVLGIQADLALLVAGVALTVDLLAPRSSRLVRSVPLARA